MWTDRQTDGQTDVGHINLIGGLVARNLPNKVFLNTNVFIKECIIQYSILFSLT